MPDGSVSWVSTRNGGDASLTDVLFPLVLILSVFYAATAFRGFATGVDCFVGVSEMAVDDARLLVHFGIISCLVFAELCFFSFGINIAVLVVWRCRFLDEYVP